jgi:hypothetical protein
MDLQRRRDPHIHLHQCPHHLHPPHLSSPENARKRHGKAGQRRMVTTSASTTLDIPRYALDATAGGP